MEKMDNTSTNAVVAQQMVSDAPFVFLQQYRERTEWVNGEKKVIGGGTYVRASETDFYQRTKKLKARIQELEKVENPSASVLMAMREKEEKLNDLYSRHMRVYPSFHYIVNAYTGEMTGIPTLSANDDCFFKVSLPAVSATDEPLSLYYSSPESYERHFDRTVSPEKKTAWRKRYNQIIRDVADREYEAELASSVVVH